MILPCLDEAETLGFCINEINEAALAAGLHCEIVVADNGSQDGSAEIAQQLGARVVEASPQGYGAALHTGIESAHSNYVVMGDADGSYNFGDLPRFLTKLRDGNDLVIGNRFAGGILPGAMPWSHRWIGNPVLSFLGRFLFHCPVRDFHCGLRGIRKSSFAALGMRSSGMEFASEMIVRAALSGLVISEVPTTLRPDGRSRPPHLRSFRDGWRHLKFLLLLCPRWLFAVPGWTLVVTGAFVQMTLMIWGRMTVAGVQLSLNTSLAAAIAIILGVHLVSAAEILKRTASTIKRGTASDLSQLRLERNLGLGSVIVIAGFTLFFVATLRWLSVGMGDLPIELAIRLTVPSLLLVAIGSQFIITTLLLGSLELIIPEQKNHQKPSTSIDKSSE